MPELTREEILDAHNALGELRDLAEELAVTDGEVQQTRKYHASILAALPPKPKPTMAEVVWDDGKHYLAEAEHPTFGKVIMLSPNAYELIDFIAPERYASRFKDTHPANLTPTGKRYELKEVQE